MSILHKQGGDCAVDPFIAGLANFYKEYMINIIDNIVCLVKI